MANRFHAKLIPQTFQDNRMNGMVVRSGSGFIEAINFFIDIYGGKISSLTFLLSKIEGVKIVAVFGPERI